MKLGLEVVLRTTDDRADRSLAPRGASGLKSVGAGAVFALYCLAPRGASGLKCQISLDTGHIHRLAPRGASGLKSV